MTATLVVVSSLWYLLFPPAAIGVLAVYCRVMSRAARAGLVHPRAIWLLRWALAGCAAFWSLTFLAAYFETELWIPVLAALLVVVMALLTRAARAGVHPGLRGFLRPLPADGLALFEEIHAPTAQRVRQWARRVAPLAPLLVLLALGAGSQVRRWPVLLALAGGLAAPLLLIAYRSAWVSPLALLLVTTTLGWRAASLDARLPAGTWTTPWAAARCAARVVPAGNGTAWCVNPHTQVIYHFQLGSGGVLEQFWLANAWDVFAANHAGAWIEQNPRGALVHLGSETPQFVAHLADPVMGIATSDNTLWYIDSSGQLKRMSTVSEDESQDLPADVQNGWVISVTALPDQTIWVSTATGVSFLPGESQSWRTFDSARTGLQGPIVEFDGAPDGAIWGLQTHTFEESIWRSWGISILRPDGSDTWLNINMRQLTGLEAPTTPDALATDAYGRAWFMAESDYLRMRYLGILTPHGELAQVVALGALTDEPYGVFSDGAGGIYLYSGESEPLRHWRP